MLDTETKRRIDTARDILVGKVPDPKSQVEQITIALIYKFMDDMDAEAEELGGTRTFFAGEFTKYSWAKLMAVGMGGYEVITLYGEAIAKMTENPGIPVLFRDIFKNAYLPYRDPETLKSFLKIINDFSYDHSEKLGDAFEYLLSVLGSQGDAGQFRTPRHIIDFMVDVIDPQKNETILDPACGTAGFLISAYKHILGANALDDKPGARLTPDERARLVNNIRGYDISPDMVRLSLVNLYLHGFTDPHIVEYDTLTSEDKWNEYADIIMANPPFMSPKGGIRPHKRFSVQSNRSEVLFVDYIAEHLTANGRAAVVVPEGIIFQSGTAYKSLRKMLVENNGLVGVISLPSGVFNPYSGVKTSILWMDKQLAKKTNQILFVKIENDGFDLGAQRREVKGDELPAVLRAIGDYKSSLASGKPFTTNYANATLVDKQRLAENDEYNLSGERYRISNLQHKGHYDLVKLGDLAEIVRGSSPRPQGDPKYYGGNVPRLMIADITRDGMYVEPKIDSLTEEGATKSRPMKQGEVVVACSGNVGLPAILKVDACIHDGFIGFRNLSKKVLPEFLYHMLLYLKEFSDGQSIGAIFKNLTSNQVSEFQIPLPPLAVQEEIVAEVDGYQKIIDGARQVVEHYQPRIDIDPAWETVALEEMCENLDGKRVPITKSDRKEGVYPYYGASGIVDYVDGFLFDEELLLVSEDGANLLARSTPIAFSVSGKIWVNNHAHVLRFPNRATQKFVENYLNAIPLELYITGSAQPKLNQQALNSIPIPLPDLATQERIITQIECEQALVKSTRELVALFEQKIKDRIAKVWGES